MKSSIKWIAITAFTIVVFCASFVYFYTKQQSEKNSPTAGIEKEKEKPLPEAKLFDQNSELLSEEDLRKGKVILIFVSPTCDACEKEGDFLRNLVGKRNDVKFYGIISFGKPAQVLEVSQSKFPFKVFFDGENSLAVKMGITKVPIKIYLEDGIIKKVWGGATIEESKQKEFIDWLETV